MSKSIETPPESRYFEGMSARAIDRMRAQIARGTATADLKAKFEAAQKAVDQVSNYAARLYIEAVRVKHNRGMGKGEIYSVGVMVDAEGKVSSFKSNIREGIGDGDLVEYSGAGFLGAEIVRPTRYVAFSVSVWESDQKARDMAAAIEEILKSNDVKGISRDIATAAGANAEVASLVERGVGLVSDLVFGMLKRNGDDQLFMQDGSVTKEQAFNLRPETVDQRYARVRFNIDRVTLD